MLFNTLRPLVLASASPRRQRFLEELGLRFTVRRPGGLEPAPLPDETPAVYALRAALAKTRAVAALYPDDLVLGADTVVTLDGCIIGKPHDADDALTMLRTLSGRTHTVVSAVALALPGGDVRHLHDSADVTFHAWPDAVLAAYARTEEPLDKAGAYAVQGVGAFLTQSIVGSWSTVVGLPLAPLVQLLLTEGIICPAEAR